MLTSPRRMTHQNTVRHLPRNIPPTGMAQEEAAQSSSKHQYTCMRNTHACHATSHRRVTSPIPHTTATAGVVTPVATPPAAAAAAAAAAADAAATFARTADWPPSTPGRPSCW